MVAAAMALYKSAHPTATLAQAKAAMRAAADPIACASTDSACLSVCGSNPANCFGAGRLRIDRFLNQ